MHGRHQIEARKKNGTRKKEQSQENEKKRMAIMTESIVGDSFGSYVAGNVEYSKWLWGESQLADQKSNKKENKREGKIKKQNVPNKQSQ